MAEVPEIVRLSPEGKYLLDLGVQLGPLLAEGNVAATCKFAKEIEHACRPSFSLSQKNWLERAVEFSVQLWTNSAELNELRATLRALRAELTREDGQ